MSVIGTIQSASTAGDSIEESSYFVRLSFRLSLYPLKSSQEFSFIGPRPSSPYLQLPLAIREVGSDVGAFIFSISRLCSILPCWSQIISDTVKSKEQRGARKQNKHTVMLSLESTAVIDMPVVHSDVKGTFTAAVVNTQNKSNEYVEWRRSLPFDDQTGWPADSTTFLRLCAQLGLYTNDTVATDVGDKCELKMARLRYGGTLTFYPHKRGKITIGQSDLVKKAAIWHLLAPWTYECQERPTKRKLGDVPAVGGRKLPSPAQLLANRA